MEIVRMGHAGGDATQAATTTNEQHKQKSALPDLYPSPLLILLLLLLVSWDDVRVASVVAVENPLWLCPRAALSRFCLQTRFKRVLPHLLFKFAAAALKGAGGEKADCRNANAEKQRRQNPGKTISET